MKPYSIYEKKEMKKDKFYLNIDRNGSCTVETVKGSLRSDGDIYELCENYSDPSSVTFEFESLKELMKKAKKCFKYVEYLKTPRSPRIKNKISANIAEPN